MRKWEDLSPEEKENYIFTFEYQNNINSFSSIKSNKLFKLFIVLWLFSPVIFGLIISAIFGDQDGSATVAFASIIFAIVVMIPVLILLLVTKSSISYKDDTLRIKIYNENFSNYLKTENIVINEENIDYKELTKQHYYYTKNNKKNNKKNIKNSKFYLIFASIASALILLLWLTKVIDAVGAVWLLIIFIFIIILLNRF